MTFLWMGLSQRLTVEKIKAELFWYQSEIGNSSQIERA